MAADNKLVLVTGGAGYLGSVMVPLLIEAGYRVRVLDRFFFGKDTLAGAGAASLELIEGDTRWCPPEIFDGVYAVIDLAALSNDPAGELDQERTLDINHRARVRTAEGAKAAGASRYILASSCSVYGFQESTADETSVPAPITTYAKASLLAEQDTLPLSGDSFAVTALRQGTLYGISPRMRFDVVVNTMTLSLVRDGVITVRGGTQWRPLVHVSDSARVFMSILEAPAQDVGGKVFNVGATDHNFQIRDIADQVLKGAGSGKVVEDLTAVDTRSYRVNADRLHALIGFVPRFTPEDGAREIREALDAGTLTDMEETRTIDWYKHLLNEDGGILDTPLTSLTRITL